MMRWLLFVVTVVLLALWCSCSAQWHLRQSIKKDPSIFDTTRQVKRDTTFIKVASVDTVFKQKRDTVIQYIQSDSIGREIRVKYIWNTKTDTVMLDVDCGDQKVITETVIETRTVKVEPTWRDYLKKYWWSLVIVIVGVLLFGRRK